MPKREFNITDAARGTALAVRIVPGGETSRITGFEDGAVTVQLAAGAAPDGVNDTLAQVFADCLCVSRRDVEVLDGFERHMKLVTVLNALAADVDRRLHEAVSAGY